MRTAIEKCTDLPKNASPQVQFFTVTEEQAGQRVDNFLFTRLKNIPKSHVYRLLRKGEVRANKKRIKPEYRLAAGDVLRIPPLWGNENERAGTTNLTPSEASVRLLESRIIYEDDALLVLNKPSGMAAHAGSGINFGVIEIMRAGRKDAPYLELVHRLDRDTSGCLMLAKKRSMLRRLHELLRDGKIAKDYVLLVRGKWQGKTRKVRAELEKVCDQSGERRMLASDADARKLLARAQSDIPSKQPLTVFAPLEIFHCEALVEGETQQVDTSLLTARLCTGKTHQIRAHAAFIEHPLAGDTKYGDREFNHLMERKFGLKRLFLHSAKLEFSLPAAIDFSGCKIAVEAPLEPDLELVLQKIRS